MGGDDFESALSQIRSLIDSAVSAHRDRQSRSAGILEVDTGRDRLVRAFGQQVAAARRTVDIAVPEWNSRSGELFSGLRRMIPEGVRVRLLSAPAAIDDDLVLRYRKGALGAEIRIAGNALQGFALVDGRNAVVCSGPPPDGRFFLVAAGSVVRVLDTLFGSAWQEALPLGDHLRFSRWAGTEPGRQVLLQLCSGSTDEVAARALSMSVRTYRRQVAELMRLLGASSRFQAGVQACRLGMLSAGPADRG
ncbi:transcriptional regulator [Peterkaempfera sp. SMS 1(5)a]|uniref:transcriptional regulator n=1 Tax=Peterkaempfera podocarpi TaxID=3232308 RepID=UPI003670F26D